MKTAFFYKVHLAVEQNAVTSFFGGLALLSHSGFWSPHVPGIMDGRTLPSLKEGQLDSAHLEVTNKTHFLCLISSSRKTYVVAGTNVMLSSAHEHCPRATDTAHCHVPDRRCLLSALDAAVSRLWLTQIKKHGL